jgi:hypothetical protein
MRTVTFKSVLWGAARLLGMDPTRDLDVNVGTRLAAYINRAVAKAWRFEQWPEWTLTEQRWFRPFYFDGLFVELSDELYFPPSDRYYQALQMQPAATQAPATLQADGTYLENSAYWAECKPVYQACDWLTGTNYGVGCASGLPYQVRNPVDGKFYQCITPHTAGAAFDPSKFALLTAFQRFVDYQQDGQTAIWEAPTVCAFRRDPRVFPNNPWPVRTGRNDRGITLADCRETSVWLKFWPKPPEFTVCPWSAGSAGSPKAYDQGALVYYLGDTFISLVGNNTGPVGSSNWGLVEFPFVLSAYVTRMAMADVLRDQKQTDRAQAEQLVAEDELQDEADKALAGQGIYETATVETAASPGVW